MPGNVFQKDSKIRSIFKDERFLYPEFVPERLPYRDAEIDSLVYALKPVSEGKKPQNVFLSGRPGTGKTVTAKFVLKELEEYSDRAKFLFINCFRLNTRHAVLTEISNFLGVPISRRGTSSDEALDHVLQAFKKISFTPIIVFDELDQLFLEGEASALFYDLLRIFEFSRARFGIVMISNNEGILLQFDSRVRSSLTPETINFLPYSPRQLKEILKERAQFAFFPDSLEEDSINVAAAHASKLGGDCRIAIECLLKAGRLAEKQNAEKLSVSHLKEVFSGIEDRAKQKAGPFLTEHEKLILELVPKKGAIASGGLYKKFSSASRNPVSQRRFREFVSKLEEKNLLECAFTEKGVKGRTRMIALKSRP
ncbi:MAG: AAA family ATPase [Candidatus ainarchaeum sp.]|nr:AAA family ATPase [Candidatus ainarchaeum sp.]